MACVLKGRVAALARAAEYERAAIIIRAAAVAHAASIPDYKRVNWGNESRGTSMPASGGIIGPAARAEREYHSTWSVY